MNLIFKICSDIVWVMAHLLGLSYEELNTVLFIYAEPAILLLSALLLPLYMAYTIWRKPTFWRIFVFLLSLFYASPFVLVCRKLWTHYSLSLHDNFVLAHRDLNYASEVIGLDYVKTILLLFIGIFFVILIFNFILLHFVRALFVTITDRQIKLALRKRKNNCGQKTPEKRESSKIKENPHKLVNKTAADAVFPMEKR